MFFIYMYLFYCPPVLNYVLPPHINIHIMAGDPLNEMTLIAFRQQPARKCVIFQHFESLSKKIIWLNREQ